jgi:hypothetical protein
MRCQIKTWSLIVVATMLSACSNNSDPYQNMVYPQTYTQSGGYNNSPQLVSSEQLQSLVSPIAL